MLRVVAYCRVSTEKEDQQNSLSSQKTYFESYIKNHPEWQLAGIYVDEGISGTATKHRHAFNQMIDDAHRDVFDFILTKEISRFARNTLDSIYYTRELKEIGIGVLFLNDNINTLDPDAELRLTILSSIAQEESRKTSERVKWGQKRRMEQGVVFGRDLLGYDVKNGKMEINREGAEIVRQIFHQFVAEGKSAARIAKNLNEREIPTKTKGKQWSSTVILRILRNEKYCGDLIQKKTYTKNYLTHEKKINRGEEEKVILLNHHEPIITRDLFLQAKSELQKRAPTPEQKTKYSSRYPFSGKIKCGICGSSFVVRSKKRKDGSVYRSWRCYEAVKNGAEHLDKMGRKLGCNSRSLGEEKLKALLKQVIKELPIEKQKLTHPIQVSIRTTEREDQNFRYESASKNITDLVSGKAWNDAFYRHIIDRITVHQNGDLIVSLKYSAVK